MRIKFLVVVSFIVLVCSCKKSQEDVLLENNQKNASQEITQKEIAQYNIIEFTLDSKTERLIENWQPYYKIKNVVVNVKKGDLSFFSDNDEGIKTLLEELETAMPSQVSSNATKARLLTLKTKLYKLKSLSSLTTTPKEELGKAMKEFLESFSNLNFQMNKKIEKDNQNIVK